MHRRALRQRGGVVLGGAVIPCLCLAQGYFLILVLVVIFHHVRGLVGHTLLGTLHARDARADFLGAQLAIAVVIPAVEFFHEPEHLFLRAGLWNGVTRAWGACG